MGTIILKFCMEKSVVGTAAYRKQKCIVMGTKSTLHKVWGLVSTNFCRQVEVISPIFWLELFFNEIPLWGPHPNCKIHPQLVISGLTNNFSYGDRFGPHNFKRSPQLGKVADKCPRNWFSISAPEQEAA